MAVVVADMDRVVSAMKASIGKNLSALMVAQIATAAISVVVLVLAPRRLGDVQFGELTVALTFLMFFDLVALLGTNIFLVKSIARDPSRVGPYVFNTLVMKVCLGGVLAVLAIASSARDRLQRPDPGDHRHRLRRDDHACR